MSKFLEDYNEKIKILERLENEAKQRYENAKIKYEKINNDELIDKKEKRLEIAKLDIIRRINILKNIETEKEFLRVGNEEIENEKNWIYHNFCIELKNKLSSDSTLCFHGCRNIYDVRNIIESGGLSSSADRLGYSTSYDVEDQVSVTTLSSLETTIHGYTGLTGELSFPAGAVFVIKPKDEHEIKTSHTSLMIGNVNFKENPDRLVAILSTSENKEKISNWIKKIGIEENVVYTFNEILENVDILEDNNQNTLK